jgi:hypothetical protein
MATHKIKVGDDEPFRATIKDADGAVIDLTGGTLKIKIAPNVDVTDANATYYKEITSFTDASNGIHDEDIANALTATYTRRIEIIQMSFISSAGKRFSSDNDRVIIEPNLVDVE